MKWWKVERAQSYSRIHTTGLVTTTSSRQAYFINNFFSNGICLGRKRKKVEHIEQQRKKSTPMFVFCHHFHECKQAEFCVHSQLVCMWLVVKIMLDIKYISDVTEWILTKFPPIWGLGGPQSSLTDPKVILTRWIAIYPNNLKVAFLANKRNKPEFSRLFTLLYILGKFWESFSPPIREGVKKIDFF